MTLKEYAKSLAEEHNDRANESSRVRSREEGLRRGKEDIAYYDFCLLYRCEQFIDAAIYFCKVRDLAIEFELPQYAALDWLLECEEARRPYFEMCGPRIPKETAAKLANAYNLKTNQENYQQRVCTVCSFGIKGTPKTNYGMFHLDGRVGLNGTFDRMDNRLCPATLHCSLLIFLIDLLNLEPDLEFAMMITKWDEVPERYRDTVDAELPSTWEFSPRPEDVSYGVAYDPKTRCIRILGPESAWKAVKEYQAQYTEEERQVFDPIQSKEYYEKDPQGRRQLSEFLNRPIQECAACEVSLQEYIQNLALPPEDTRTLDIIVGLEEWKNLYSDLQLKILTEDPRMLTRRWLLQFKHYDHRPSEGEKKYFEICGPRIAKQDALHMAADYNEPSVRSMPGEMCSYDRMGGSGVFHLDGSVGGSGILLKAHGMEEILDSVLDTISTYPNFEFMLLIFHAVQVAERENGIAVYEQRAVEVGMRYDPAQKQLTILGPRSACCMLKKYQAEYTEEEHRLFEKEACRQYYSHQPKGKAELAEFVEYQQNVFQKQM